MTDDKPDVNVIYRKYDGALHWHFTTGLLGEDDHGVWLAMPRGTVARRGHDHEHVEDRNSVLLIPHDQWWTAHFNDSGDIAVYCDITTVPTWRDDEVTMIDLDLDVVRRTEGSVYIDDEDEFAEHQVRYGYAAHVTESARRTADDLRNSVEREAGPFGGAHERWLAQVVEPTA